MDLMCELKHDAKTKGPGIEAAHRPLTISSLHGHSTTARKMLQLTATLSDRNANEFQCQPFYAIRLHRVMENAIHLIY